MLSSLFVKQNLRTAMKEAGFLSKKSIMEPLIYVEKPGFCDRLEWKYFLLSTLGKEEDREHIERIDSLVEEIEKDLTKIDTSVALSAIDEWYTLLHKSEDESIKEISNGLKELKQILKRRNAKGADIGELLTRIGEQTQESAKEACRGLKGPIQRLGKMLSKAGKSLD